jgi:hypothetical protein
VRRPPSVRCRPGRARARAPRGRGPPRSDAGRGEQAPRRPSTSARAVHAARDLLAVPDPPHPVTSTPRPSTTPSASRRAARRPASSGSSWGRIPGPCSRASSDVQAGHPLGDLHRDRPAADRDERRGAPARGPTPSPTSGSPPPRGPGSAAPRDASPCRRGCGGSGAPVPLHLDRGRRGDPGAPKRRSTPRSVIRSGASDVRASSAWTSRTRASTRAVSMRGRAPRARSGRRCASCAPPARRPGRPWTARSPSTGSRRRCGRAPPRTPAAAGRTPPRRPSSPPSPCR